jgi:hypothetical protein
MMNFKDTEGDGNFVLEGRLLSQNLSKDNR